MEQIRKTESLWEGAEGPCSWCLYLLTPQPHKTGKGAATDDQLVPARLDLGLKAGGGIHGRSPRQPGAQKAGEVSRDGSSRGP